MRYIPLDAIIADVAVAFLIGNCVRFSPLTLFFGFFLSTHKHETRGNCVKAGPIIFEQKRLRRH
jgi:hypothetical protein